MYARLNLDRHAELNPADGKTHLDPNDGPAPPHDAIMAPDVMGPLRAEQQVYRNEHLLSAKIVPFLRPSVLYVSGAGSPLCKAGVHARSAKRTGTQWSGSGGVEYGRVEHILVPKAGHALPLEKVGETADAMGPWISKEVKRFAEDERRLQDKWENLSVKEKATLGPAWKDVIDNLPGVKEAAMAAQKKAAEKAKAKAKL